MRLAAVSWVYRATGMPHAAHRVTATEAAEMTGHHAAHDAVQLRLGLQILKVPDLCRRRTMGDAAEAGRRAGFDVVTRAAGQVACIAGSGRR